MAANYTTTSHLPFLNQFQRRDRKALERALTRRDAKVRQDAEVLTARIDKADGRLGRALERTIGADALRKVTAAKLAGRARGWRGPVINRRRVAALLKAHAATIAELTGVSRSLPELRLPHDFELPPTDPNDPHRWVRHEPPFFGFLFDYWQWCKGGFRADYELFLQPSTGLVGARVDIACDDADFDGLAQARAEAQIAFAFTPPVAGVLEVVVDAMSLKSRVDVDITDNWWLSAAGVHLNNYVTLSVLHPQGPELQEQPMDQTTVNSDGDNVSAHHSHLNLVQHYFAHFFTAQPVPANRPLILAVGSRNMDIASARNMTVRSRTDFQWFLNAINVRVVP